MAENLGTKVAVIMLLVAFSSGAVVSATHGSLRQSRAGIKTTVVHNFTTTQTSNKVYFTTTVLTRTTSVRVSPQITITGTNELDGYIHFEATGFRPNDNITVCLDRVNCDNQTFFPFPVRSDSSGHFGVNANIPYSVWKEQVMVLLTARDSEGGASFCIFYPSYANSQIPVQCV